MDEKYTVVGARLPMLDAGEKVKGAARYTDDIVMPGMLHGKILRSPFPHAKILNIDVSKAQKLIGVKGVITGKDIPDKLYGIVPKAKDESALAKSKVRHVGEAVVAVCAIDPEIAEEAIDLIKVEYEELPGVFDPLDAIKEGAPLVHDNTPNNISASIHKSFGEGEKAFDDCDFVFDNTFYSQAINHAPLEPHAAVAQFDPLKGEMVIWSSTQIPFFLRRNLSTTILIPESKIRVIKPRVGGGFGQKIDMFSKDFCACWFARQTGRPVKFLYDREEIFVATRQRHPMYVRVKTGMKKDGTIHAQRFWAHADGGAYNSTAPLMITLSCYFLMVPYRVPNLVYEGYHVYTNKPVGGAMRGHGIPQARFAVERQLDMISVEMGIDPAELRLKNSLHAHEPHPGGFILNTCGFAESVEKAAEAIGWKEKRGKLPYGRGVGMGGASFPSGVSNMSHLASGAVVQLGQDGAVTLLTGAADIGQGAETVIAQIVAEELGVRLEDIRVTAADTGITPLDAGTFGSGVTVRAGNAALEAAISLKKKLFEFVAKEMEANPLDLVAKDRLIYVKGSPDKSMPLMEAVKRYRYADLPMPIVGRGSWMAPASEPTTLLSEEGNFAPNYSFMTQAAEVEIDFDTGRVKVLKMVTAHDCGTAINPLLVEGQLDGSIMGGIGHALYENVITDKGQVMNPSFLDYGFPTALEMPEMEGLSIETHDPVGPFGAKESGEGTQLAPAPAIVNAIYDAIGVDFMELPITPEKILNALEENKKSGKARS